MAALRFDTLDYARKLERAGVPREQAALQAKALGEALAQTDSIHADIGRLDRRFDQVDARFDQVDARFKEVDARFDQVDARFKQVDARFEQVDARFEHLESKLGARIDALDVKLSGKIATLHWMFGTMVAMVAAIFIQQMLRP
jgi:septal ring factor EnvC (AmiA/AmiB activator)